MDEGDPNGVDRAIENCKMSDKRGCGLYTPRWKPQLRTLVLDDILTLSTLTLAFLYATNWLWLNLLATKTCQLYLRPVQLSDLINCAVAVGPKCGAWHWPSPVTHRDHRPWPDRHYKEIHDITGFLMAGLCSIIFNDSSFCPLTPGFSPSLVPSPLMSHALSAHK